MTTCEFFSERNKETPEEMEGTVHDNGSASGGKFLQTEYQNIKPRNPSTEDWCISEDMKECD